MRAVRFSERVGGGTVYYIPSPIEGEYHVVDVGRVWLAACDGVTRDGYPFALRVEEWGYTVTVDTTTSHPSVRQPD